MPPGMGGMGGMGGMPPGMGGMMEFLYYFMKIITKTLAIYFLGVNIQIISVMRD